MIRLLQKYQQWLVCFFASLLLVVFSSVIFAQQAPAQISNVPSNVANLDQHPEYDGFVASHLEPNYYN